MRIDPEPRPPAPASAASAAPPAIDRADVRESEVAAYDVSAWDLSELLPAPSEEVVAERLEAIESLVSELEAARSQLDPAMDPDEFLRLLRLYERILDRMDVLGGYASLWFSSNTQSSEAVAFRNRIRQVLTGLHNRFLFFSLWWKGLDDGEAERLRPRAETHGDYRHYLDDLRRFKPFTLPEASEQIINTKDANGIDAVVTLYSMLTNRMEFQVEVEGEERTLTEEEMRSQFFSTDPDLRRRTYQELFRVYERDAPILAQIYANRVRDWYTEYVELRGFESPIAVRNLTNDISDQAVTTMLDVVSRNAAVFQEYFRLKGAWLGLGEVGIEQIRRYDIYAPLAASAQKVPYREGVASVLSTFRSFHPRFAEQAERVFREGHIDSEIRKGKRSGAFCATI
ncbi:MAG: M3 family metallopeptidase, partial [Holophagales bacterium]|nr:M3 family metallopeptidase [Holophagales bacterium]